MPAFAAADGAAEDPGLVSERTVTYEDGTTITIRLYNLDKDGNIPGPQPRQGETVLYNHSTWLSTGGWSTLVWYRQPARWTETVSCMNNGPQAVTFRIDYVKKDGSEIIEEQAVASDQGCQFVVSQSLGYTPLYSISAKANWSDHQSSIRIICE